MAPFLESVQDCSPHAWNREFSSATGLREAHRETDFAVALGVGSDRQDR